MDGIYGGAPTVTLRVHRFQPRPERGRKEGSSPSAKTASPFGGSPATSTHRVRGRQWTQDYTVQAHRNDTVLDCLLRIRRDIDPTLGFRYSCGHGMCGSDAVAINGTSTLLCTAIVGQWARPVDMPTDSANQGFRRTASAPAGDASYRGSHHGLDAGTLLAEATDQARTNPQDTSLGVIELSALPGFAVQRDLIVDIDPMLEQIKRLKPYLQADGVLASTHEGGVDVFEYLQRPEQLAKYELLSNCIACGVCEGSCPVFSGGDAFVGPAALVAASRFINDSRDTAVQARLEAIDTADGVAACQSVRACSRQCPRGIDVGEEMWQLIAKVKERQ